MRIPGWLAGLVILGAVVLAAVLLAPRFRAADDAMSGSQAAARSTADAAADAAR